jgi:transcriptional regulator with XRE-family HTH domain
VPRRYAMDFKAAEKTGKKSKQAAKPKTVVPPLLKPKGTRGARMLAQLPASELEVRREFARRLQTAMYERGWNGSELARQAAKHTPDGRFGKDLISRYRKGEALPYPASLNALCKALGKGPNDLIPIEAYQNLEEMLPDADIKTAGEGMAWLRISKKVPMDLALKIMALINKGAE